MNTQSDLQTTRPKWATKKKQLKVSISSLRVYYWRLCLLTIHKMALNESEPFYGGKHFNYLSERCINFERYDLYTM